MAVFEGKTRRLSVEARPGSSYFVLHGELDLSTVGHFEDVFDGNAADGDVILDVSQVTFVDVVGLHALVRVGRALAKRHKHLVLREPCPSLRTMMAVLGDDRFSDLYTYPHDGGYHVRNVVPQHARPHGVAS
jgi:anti-anti-sigma factor